MKGLWSWLTKKRQFPGPLRYVGTGVIFGLKGLFRLIRAVITLKRILAACLVLVLVHTGLNIWAYHVLQREIEKTQAAGIKLHLYKYHRRSKWNELNAAPIYGAAFELIRMSMNQEDAFPRHEVKETAAQGPASAGTPGRVESFFSFADVRDLKSYYASENVTRAFELMEWANQMPQCNWELQYREGYNTVLLQVASHLDGLFIPVRVVLTRACLNYVTGDEAGAIRDVRRAIRLAESIESDRLLFSEMRQCGIAEICVMAAQRMLTAGPMSAESLQELGDALHEFQGLLRPTEVLRLETAMAYDWSERMRGKPAVARETLGYDPSRFWFLPYLVTYPFRPLYRLSQADLLRSERQLVELSQQPYYMVRDRLNAIDADLSTRARALIPLYSDSVTEPQLDAARAQAKIRTARVGLALEAHRDKTGSYPSSLASLTPEYLSELPVDPFSGKDFLYRLSDEELVVYSVGKNGIDDGGLTETQEGPKKINPGTDDISWRVKR